MRLEILEDFKEHGFSFKTLHDHYAKKLEELKDTDKFGEYHETQNKLTGLYSMYKNGELPEPSEPEVTELDDKKVPLSLVPVPPDSKPKDVAVEPDTKTGPAAVPLFVPENK
jgi:hypothetical protein